MLKQLLRSVLVVTLLAAALPLVPAAQAAPGDPDPGFGGFGDAGVVIVDDQVAMDMALQPDGKLVTVVHPGNDDLAVLRFLQNGQPDSTFGVDGQALIPAPVGITVINPKAIALQPDGKIVVAGHNTHTDSNGGSNFLLLRLTSAGALDTTFGNQGFVLTDFFQASDGATSVKVQPNGKIVAAGWATLNGSERGALARYNPNGTLDDTSDGDGGFGPTGRVTLTANGFRRANDLVLQTNGKLVVVGVAQVGDDDDFVVARLETNGTLDDNNGDGGFSGDGVLTTGFGDDQEATAVALDPDGRLVVVGHATYTAPVRSFVARYTANGDLDGSFGSGGKLTVPVDVMKSLALQPDGRVLLLGYHTSPDFDNKIAFHRLLANGTHDSSFDNGDGIAFLDFGGSDMGREVTLLPDGRLLVLGSSNNRTVLLRFWADGLTIDAGGQQAHGLSFPHKYQPGYRESAFGMAVQPDGRFVVAGQVYAPNFAFSDAFVARFTPDGLLDGAFGVNGSARVVAGLFTAARAVAVQPDGKVVVAGFTAFDTQLENTDFMVARFNADGTRDDSFGNSGKYLTDFAGGADSGTALALAPDGKIVVAGTVWNGTGYDWGVLRLTAGGLPDSTFDNDGYLFFGYGLSNGATSVAVQPDGKIVVAGHVDRNFALARLLDSGVIDTSFGDGGYRINDLGGTDVINALTLAPDGWIYAAGHRVQNGGSDMALAQYTPDGQLAVCPANETCAHWPTGTFFVDAGINDYAYALDVRADHQLVAAGCSNQHFAAVQVPTNSEPTPLPFNTDFVGYPDCANAVKFTGANQLILAGNQSLYPFSGDSNAALARFETVPYADPSLPAYRLFLPLVRR